MIESGYYPIGAQYDKDAPWNEKDPPIKNFEVCISQTLSKTVKVVTNKYRLENEGAELFIDTKDTDWKEIYNEEHYTPIELINKFKEFLVGLHIDPIATPNEYLKYKKLISECENWIEDETEVLEN